MRRALPSAQRAHGRPLHLLRPDGPGGIRAGAGVDVRPHPHIGLATVTYLFDGEILHRDSLGTFAAIRPGEVNWMTAGRGIVHSERTGAGAARERRQAARPAMLGGAAEGDEEMAPGFAHHDAERIAASSGEGKTVRARRRLRCSARARR